MQYIFHAYACINAMPHIFHVYACINAMQYIFYVYACINALLQYIFHVYACINAMLQYINVYMLFRNACSTKYITNFNLETFFPLGSYADSKKLYYLRHVNTLVRTIYIIRKPEDFLQTLEFSSS